MISHRNKKVKRTIDENSLGRIQSLIVTLPAISEISGVGTF